MSSPSDYERLLHIKEATDLIMEYTQPLDLAEFHEDRKTQLSVERLLEILGEAASHISPELRANYPDVPWRQIVGLRNVVSHEYFQVRLDLIWGVAINDIPPLAIRINQILESLGRKGR